MVGNHWSEEELAALKDNSKSVDNLAKELNRSRLQVLRKRRFIIGASLKPWSPEELAYLNENLQTSSMDEIAIHLGRSVLSVKRQIWAGKTAVKSSASLAFSVNRFYI